MLETKLPGKAPIRHNNGMKDLTLYENKVDNACKNKYSHTNAVKDDKKIEWWRRSGKTKYSFTNRVKQFPFISVMCLTFCPRFMM